MTFDDTILGKHVLHGSVIPKTVPSLLSFARSEYLATKSYDGKFMKELASLFCEVGHKVYKTGFMWSDYNEVQWEKFVASRASSPEGGACMFSMEEKGDYNGQGANEFKGLGLGVPTGMFPYSMWICDGRKNSVLVSAVAGLDRYTLDLIAD